MTGTMTVPRTLASLIDEVGGRGVCLAMSKDPAAKVTILLFPPGSKRPGCVAKVPTTDAAAGSIEREAIVLAEIASRNLGPLGNTLPRIITTAEHDGRPVLVTSALPGQAMLAAYHTWRHTGRPAAVGADFAAASSWLSELQHSTAGGDIDLASMLDGVADAIGRRFGGRPDASAAVADIAALQGSLVGQRLPGTFVHGDFWPGNLLIAAGRVSGVIDWEAGRPQGPPTRDIARFVIAYSLYLDRHTRSGRRVAGHSGLRADSFGAGVEYAVDGAGWYPDIARGFMTDALLRLGVQQSCGRDVLMAELAAIAAEADHTGFAWEHLGLFRRMYRRGHQ